MADNAADQRIRKLLESGEQNGYILYTDMDGLFSDSEDEPRIQDLLAVLESAGVTILSVPPGLADDMHTVDPANDPVAVYLKEVCAVRPISKDVEIELAKQLEVGGSNAENAERQLIEANLSKVVSIAKGHAGCGVHVLDLIQKGNTALVGALKRFDWHRGCSFSAYAGWCVRKVIMGSLREQDSRIRLE